MTRDPRIDPRPGDVVLFRAQLLRRVVVRVADGFVWSYLEDAETSVKSLTGSMTITDWRTTCIPAEVVTVAEVPE